MLRSILRLTLLSLMFVPVGYAQKTDAQAQKPRDPLESFYWINTASGNRGLILESRTLTPFTLDPRAEVPSDVQSEVTRPDANTLHIVRRSYHQDVNGRNTIVELVTEEVRRTPNNGLSATRTVSRRDTNGQMVQVETISQETVATGGDSYKTQATVSRGSGSLAPVEQVVQLEKKKGDGTVEIDRTNFRPGSSGALAASERRISSTKQAQTQVTGQEDVYRQDGNGTMSLVRHEAIREWKDAGGNSRGEIETQLPDSAGRLQLNARISIVTTTAADGSQLVTQTTSQVSPAAPSRGLQVSEKVVQTNRAAGAGAIEKEIEVQKPDVNGALQTIAVQRITEKK
jgi:hypothetical protein